MFTGLIETKGTVAHLQKHPGGARLTVRAPQIAGSLELGDSVAVNGCCVTVVEHDEQAFTADLVPETLGRSSLGVLAVGAEVNLERAMAAGDRFGGHWVQGHVDTMATVRSRKRVGTEDLLELTIPFEVARFIVPQGSITLDGVSLTVVDVGKDRVRVALIPHTREMTTLGKIEPMDVVNVELDVLAKYVDRHIQAYVARLPRMLREANEPGANGGSPQDHALTRDKLSRPKEPRSRAVTSIGSRPSAERAPAETPKTAKKTPAAPKAAAKRTKKAAKTKTAKKAVASARKAVAQSKTKKTTKPATVKKATASKTAKRKTSARKTTGRKTSTRKVGR